MGPRKVLIGWAASGVVLTEKSKCNGVKRNQPSGCHEPCAEPC
jgi:hypothetical protein